MGETAQFTMRSLRLLVLLLFACVCYQTGYTAGFNTGEAELTNWHISKFEAAEMDVPSLTQTAESANFPPEPEEYPAIAEPLATSWLTVGAHP